MSKTDLPNESAPLSPWEYWQESLRVWGEFSQRTAQIMVGHAGASIGGKAQSLDESDDTLASEWLRTLSDMNLRHWQNTARFLEGLPSWTQVPHSLTGSALVDWFDAYQRKTGTRTTSDKDQTELVSAPDLLAPKTLLTPDGTPDDLTQIKGIGPKLSSRLNDLGIYHFKQIADWSTPEARWVEDHLSSKGRVHRENWVSQARKLTANGSATLH